MKNKAKSTTKTTLRTMLTDLPGLGEKEVIVSSPQLVKENSQHVSPDKKDTK